LNASTAQKGGWLLEREEHRTELARLAVRTLPPLPQHLADRAVG
jgi:hypothetical protein